MKKIYLPVLACLLFTIGLHAQQTYRWIGPSGAPGGNWNDGANWSHPGGGSAIPTAVDDVLFDQNALVNLNVATIDLNSITVTNNVTARLFTSIAVSFGLSSTSLSAPALQIDAGSTLVDSTSADVDFSMDFQTNAKALINGTWEFKSVLLTANNGPYFSVPSASGAQNRVDVNGKIYIGQNAGSFNAGSGDNYLFFNAGSEYHVDRNGGSIIRANYDPASTIHITGMINKGMVYGGVKPLGNILVDCPLIDIPSISLALRNIKVQGNLQVLNTNGKDVILVGNGSNPSPVPVRDTVMGNIEISGNSSVAIANAGITNTVVFFYVYGDINAGGIGFDIQRHNAGSTSDQTTLVVKGNINHTAGVFAPVADRISTSEELYVLELNGTTNQTISSVTGTFDNTQNQFVLRMNNAAGATLLTSLNVGKLSFDSENKGIITTSPSTFLRINNTNNSTNTLNSPSDNGYVDGSVRRRTAGTSTYSLPTGKGGKLRSCAVIPAATTLSVYQAEYFNSQHSDPGAVAPLTAISSVEYWDIAKIVGADASVRLTLAGALPGANASDEIVVAHYDGTDWVNAKGTNGTMLPGNATSGSVISDVMTTFSPFTFAYGPQAALPVKLLSFNAVKETGNRATLNWKITTSSTPEFFEVLRSADGREFQVMGKLQGGNKYEFTYVDDALPSGISYYKLRMVDVDGSVTFSRIVPVMNGNSSQLITSLIPTVVTSTARLNITSGVKADLLLVITDMHGRIVHRLQTSVVAGSQDIMMNLQPLAAGAYQLTGYVGKQRAATIRFIKQ